MGRQREREAATERKIEIEVKGCYTSGFEDKGTDHQIRNVISL